MEEQSHKREMSDAVRADFERLRERGVVSSLSVHDSQAPAEDVPATEPAGEPPEERSLLSRLLRRA
jgi:hypothetical protein